MQDTRPVVNTGLADTNYLFFMLDTMFQIRWHPQQPLDLIRAEILQRETAATL